LAAAVDDHTLGFDRRRIRHAELRGQTAQGVLPESVLHPVRQTDGQAEFEQRIAGAHQRSDLGDDLAAVPSGTEGVEPRELMAPWRHDRERRDVGVQHEHLGRHAHTPDLGVEHYHVP
jgi:hypothetical protein